MLFVVRALRPRLSRSTTTDKPRGVVSLSNLTRRVITAAIAIPLLLLLIYRGPSWGWFLFVLLATVLSAVELFGMTHPKDPTARAFGIVQSAAAASVLYFFHDDARVLLTLIIVLPMVGFLAALWRLGEVNTAALRLMAGAAAPLYLALLSMLAVMHQALGNDGPGYVVLTLMMAWMTDTGGYFAGRAFGRTKLYEAVSPKKTREGFAGGVLGALLGALLAHYWYLPSLPLGHALVLAVACACLGQLGDLAESLLKRSTAIKDSGSLLPGHGGLLDRVDGVLFVAPTVYLYALWNGLLSTP
jgi:phosphatidate cytidylyltransferase